MQKYTYVIPHTLHACTHLGEVKRVEGALLSLLKGHHLDVHGPSWLEEDETQKIISSKYSQIT